MSTVAKVITKHKSCLQQNFSEIPTNDVETNSDRPPIDDKKRRWCTSSQFNTGTVKSKVIQHIKEGHTRQPMYSQLKFRPSVPAGIFWLLRAVPFVGLLGRCLALVAGAISPRVLECRALEHDRVVHCFRHRPAWRHVQHEEVSERGSIDYETGRG